MTAFLRRGSRWITLATLVLLPLSTVHIITAPRAVSLANLLILLTMLTVAGSLVVRAIRWEPLRDSSLLTVLAGLAVALIWGLAHSHPLSSGAGTIVSRFLLPLGFGMSVALLIANRLLTPGEFLAAIATSLVTLALIDFLQVLRFLPSADPARPTGVYLYPNTLGRYITYGVLLTSPWLIASYARTPNPGLVGGWLTVGLALLLTISYGAIVTLAIGLAFTAAWLPTQFRRLKQVSLAIGVVALIALLPNFSRLPQYQTKIHESLVSRLEYWSVAQAVLNNDHHWLTGIGLKTWELDYSQLVERYGPSPPLNWASPHPHNVILDSAVRAGIPGIVAILAFLAWPIYRVLRSSHDTYWWYMLGVAALSIGALVFGILDDPLWSDDVMPLIMACWFVLATLPLLTAKRPADA